MESRISKNLGSDKTGKKIRMAFLLSFAFHAVIFYVFIAAAHEGENASPLLEVVEIELNREIKKPSPAKETKHAEPERASVKNEKKIIEQKPIEHRVSMAIEQAVLEESPFIAEEASIIGQPTGNNLSLSHADDGDVKALEDEVRKISHEDIFNGMVREKIERAKFYPLWARKRGYEGVVGVRFGINPDGSVNGVRVVRPCHCELLNTAAEEAIKKAAPFGPVPESLARNELNMEVDIIFRLE